MTCENESGFLNPTDNWNAPSTDFEDVQSVYTSHNGICNVYRAQRNGRWWALKTLKPEVAADPMANAILKKEYDIGSQLNHVNIAHTEGLEVVPGLGTCLISEWVEGTTLRQRITDNSLNLNEIKHIVTQICDALIHMNERQISHRDLKPENIMISTDGCHVKLIDMGSADGDGYAMLKISIGTRKYAAPEQMNNGQHVDSRADVWALGSISRELASIVPWWQRERLLRVARQCMHTEPHRRCSLQWVKAEVNRSVFTPRRIIVGVAAMVLTAATCAVCSSPVTFKGWIVNTYNVMFAPETQPGQAIDLGLSVKWADRNIDASSPNAFGSYYAYGELKPKMRYTPSTQQWLNDGKWSGPVDGADIAPQWDVARQKWKGNWRTPTYNELLELIKKCHWQWTQLAGMSGYRVTGPSGQSIFLPAVGFNRGMIPEQVGTAGFYLTTTSKSKVPGDAMQVDFYSDGRIWHFGTAGSIGMAVRPVCE